ncbi:hypothetical protein B0T22DRAFT_215577 [Podospora appendiculata]|uniref:Uncharacterized protein n=1 Tax=Podospora appendiculata TaxID=314037 RepID=A0AAE1CA88_9PEZI|nr:hypothetical protein B0T22DRAFT_215577 [Podospora appendiculata]
MCLQINYTLPCEHIKREMIYCGDAIVEKSSGVSESGSVGRAGGGSNSSKTFKPKLHSTSNKSKKGKQHKTGEDTPKTTPHAKERHRALPTSSSSSPPMPPPPPPPPPQGQQECQQKRPCAKLSIQSQPYPMPPSFASDPATISSSLLSPRCPVADCPFEQKQRCWNCCACGKGWNTTGRCACIMLVEGNMVPCGHVCCPECHAAADSVEFQYSGYIM